MKSIYLRYITTGLEWSWYARYITLRCYIKFPSFSFLWIKFDAFCEQLGFSFGTFGMALRLDGIPLRKFLLQWRWLVVVGETTGCLCAVRLWKSWKYKVYNVHTHTHSMYLSTNIMNKGNILLLFCNFALCNGSINLYFYMYS